MIYLYFHLHNFLYLYRYLRELPKRCEICGKSIQEFNYPGANI